VKQALLAFLLFFSFISPLQAETMYLNDKLIVPLRSGEGLQYRIVHKGVKSGTLLNVLEQDKVSGYSKVSTPDGIIGYLPSRFLSKTPIARDLLAKAQAEKQKAIIESSNLSKQLKDLQQKNDDLQQNFASLSKKFEKQSNDYTELQNISHNAVSLDKRNTSLRLENEKLKNDVELLSAENNRLKDNNTTNKWLVGGGLVVLGMFIAVLLPLFKPTKKSDGWT
jgi:SH3 domain protein